MTSPERHLPQELLDRASLRGKEYAWRVDDIPEVIEAARSAGLVSIGGQLQFRLPDGGICECYWVEVDTYRSVSKELPWPERVARTADVASADFTRLASEYDFLEEGRRAFRMGQVDPRDKNPAEMMWFVWYVLDAEEGA